MIEERGRSPHAEAVKEAERIFHDTKEMLRPVTIILDQHTADDLRKIVLDGYANIAGKNRRITASADDKEEEQLLAHLINGVSRTWNERNTQQSWVEISITGKEMDITNSLVFAKIADYTETLYNSSDFSNKPLLEAVEHWNWFFDEINEAFVYAGGKAREPYQAYLDKVEK